MNSLLLTLLFPAIILATATSVVDPIHPDELICMLNSASPLYLDCHHAFISLPVAGEPNHISNSSMCTDPENERFFHSDWTLGSAGECKIESYHSKGEAHCIPPALVREAVQNIFAHCRSTLRVTDDENWKGREVEITQARWYVDGSEYGRKKGLSKAWVEISKIRDTRWIGPETGAGQWKDRGE